MKKIFYILIFITLTIIFLSFDENTTVLKGPYLGQKLPKDTPEYFAPGIITTRHHQHSAPAFSPDGKEVYWSVFLAPLQARAPQVILYSKIEKGVWSKPQVAPFSGQYSDGSPCFTYDGNRIYFASDRPLKENGESRNDLNIWYVNKTEQGWSIPESIGSVINTDEHESRPTVTSDGSLYYVGHNEAYKNGNCIFRARLQNGIFQEPELLPVPINVEGKYSWCPFITKD
ncbi:MAG: PD40 domain-containing protein, partial [Acidobacteria bacterium]|nr:PD40 domain-containing protein [Acidobacteriota bacterium]